MKARAEIIVEGLVQGVGYRAFAKRVADKLGLKGYAENLPDGTVKIIVEGEKDQIEDFIEECRRGPPLSEVENLEVKWEQYKGEFDSFYYF
ncbi:MAG: acylphosphatase [Nitrososphaeria archaeon]|jgi:acylphosphatase|nr:acylphosphatase [Nitrososphaerota archaeon]